MGSLAVGGSVLKGPVTLASKCLVEAKMLIIVGRELREKEDGKGSDSLR